jgi:hypothetical protein
LRVEASLVEGLWLMACELRNQAREVNLQSSIYY